ncbi:MAG TPA: NAD(P)/FAD-dependent oxidoreductase [Acidimicrobiales bacterium]|nr:NAD(P)/FAD-dependent oxidoreductase [Acidimicrobiales bacterium]
MTRGRAVRTDGLGARELVHLVVVGAGPSGAFAALAAAERGFRVTLLEAAERIDRAPRAATFHPSTLEMIEGLGIMDDFVRVGLVARYFDFWDKPSHSLIARFDHDVLREDTRFPFVAQVEQHKLVDLILRRLESNPDVVVHRGARAVSLTQDEKTVTVGAKGSEGGMEVTGDWLVGADGGRSTIRAALGVEFDGYTWPERFVVLTTTFDFEAAIGCSYRSYFADPDGWANVFKVAGDDLRGRWRVVSATEPDESDDEALGDAASARRLRALSADAGVEHIEHRNLYKVHQRVASKFRVGRAFLVGDAAHVNNPIGGLGLNCGIHDVAELIGLLAEARDTECESVVEKYEPRRRAINIRYVQEQTVDNKRRLEEQSAEERAQRRTELERMAADPSRQREFLMRTSLLGSLPSRQRLTPVPDEEHADRGSRRRTCRL